MDKDGPSAAWFAMREQPMWVCAGGPLDGSMLTTKYQAGVHRDAACAAAGGYYVLKNKQEGRFCVPTATWQLDESPSKGD